LRSSIGRTSDQLGSETRKLQASRDSWTTSSLTMPGLWWADRTSGAVRAHRFGRGTLSLANH